MDIGVLTPEKKCFLVKVRSSDKKNTIENNKGTCVHPVSVVYTDMLRGYIDRDQELFEHHTVNHSKYFKYHATGANTNTVEGLWNGVIRPKIERKIFKTD